MIIKWIGRGFDPEAFDLDDVKRGAEVNQVRQERLRPVLLTYFDVLIARPLLNMPGELSPLRLQ